MNADRRHRKRQRRRNASPSAPTDGRAAVLAFAATVSPWLNAGLAAAYLDRGRRYVLAEIRGGRLRAARIGGRGEILTRVEWLDAWVTDQEKPVPVVARRRA